MIGMIFCRAEPCSAQMPRVQQPSMGSALQRAPDFAFDLLILFRGWHAQETVRGRAGRLRRGVSRMDAATELTWMYLQRPLRSLPARPTP
ncbi:hypothetical protein A7326_16475 [Stenotrophomonas maltophilia]|nr:hypothetical protein A7326_16475 [Stenotrophomonas maltophilia]